MLENERFDLIQKMAMVLFKIKNGFHTALMLFC